MDEQLPIIQELWDPEIARETRERLRGRTSSKVNKQKNLEGVQRAFEAAGGMDRLAYEFNANFKEYMFKFGHRLLPDEKQELDVNFTIHPAIPRSPLDGEYTDVAERRAYSGDEHLLPQGCAPQGVGSSGGPENSASQDGESSPFQEPQDTEAGSSGSHAAELPSRLTAIENLDALDQILEKANAVPDSR